MELFFYNIKIYTIRKKWTFLFICIVFGAILLFNCELIQLEVFGAILGSAITAYLGILKQSMDDDQVFRELFTTFNARYSNETNDLLNELRRGEGQSKHLVLNEKEKNLIIDYFNLCSEEYLWYLKGRIPSNVWEAWLAGIEVNLKIPIVKELFIEETKTKPQKISYYGFAEFIATKLQI